ncbi:VPS10 domain-containing receptor SorCS1 [Thelohanellus kitauei]|uniref:VPS10 domain-containing receptor SorCS1 n=1 Tax=Thelohanellus kitauei TaxID=669202 RepID=A0A0C2IYU0_THEKT|nr:VPS10 domain-containing receptor SorCS1 [Thelohanellus kitauei]
MGIFSIYSFRVLWGACLISYFLNAGIKIQANLTVTDEEITVANKVFKGENDKLEFVRNQFIPDLIIFFNKEDQKTGKGAIYKYDRKKSSFIQVTFIASKNVSSLETVIPSGNKLFCISLYHKIGFYINQSFKIEHEEAVESNYQYILHPDYPNIGIRIHSRSNIGVYIGESRWEEYRYRNDLLLFLKFDYVPKTKKYVYLSPVKEFIIHDGRPNMKLFSRYLVPDYMIVRDKVLLIERNADNYLTLSILDIQTNKESATYFPSLLKIKKVKRFDHAFENYYLELVHHDLTTCLWTTTATPYHFMRSVCYNIPLHDPQDVPDNFEAIDIQYQELKDVLKPFITFDSGYTWKAMPKTRSNVLLLNYASIILSVDLDTNFINYSTDAAITWTKYKLFTDRPKVLIFRKLSNSNQKVFMVTRVSSTKELNFTIIDFSNIFKLDCQSFHYNEWRLPKSDRFCYRKNCVTMTSRKPEIKCLDKKQNHIKEKLACNCTSDDFGCTFGYMPFADICVPDSLSDIDEWPHACNSESNDAVYYPGYVKLAQDTCRPHDLYRDINKISSNFCVRDEWTNILVLYTSDRLYMLRILIQDSDIGRNRPLQVDLHGKVNVSAPIAFDYPRQLLYSFQDGYITKLSFLVHHNQRYISRVMSSRT